MGRNRRRRRRRPIPDRHRAGRSEIVPYKPDEPAWQRHQRRFAVAQRSEFLLREWCCHRGLTLDVTNHGHHWIVRKSGTCFAQWWPASAKLVLAFRYRDGIHCHDWVQVAKILYRQLYK